jgi:glycine C-acetyltransferase
MSGAATGQARMIGKDYRVRSKQGAFATSRTLANVVTMNDRLQERVHARLQRIRSENRWKSRKVFSSGPGARIRTAQGRELLLFTSNDYLGLACDARVTAAGESAAGQYGAGTASARFVCGTTQTHLELERELAELCATESALAFNSGWSANLGLLATLPEPGDLVLSDALNHASLIDGARLAAREVERVVYPHGDLRTVERTLAEWRGSGIAYCITDGVFSMEGSQAPIAGLLEITRRYGAVLIVDDAHGIGVVGARGRGCAEAAGVLGSIDIVTGSLGKALGGVAGGFVAGPESVTALLEQTARAMLFTTALTPSAAASSREAVRLLKSEPSIVRELQGKVKYFVEEIAELLPSQTPAQSAIVPLIVGGSAKAQVVAHALEEAGIFASCFSYPVVPEGQARLRFQVSRAHGFGDLSYCAAACRRVLSG